MKNKIVFVIVMFFIFFIWNIFLVPLNLDEVWNYGFAHNMYKGLIPYKDFNMVLTPLYPFFMSLPFHLFSSSMLVFHIEQALILSILSLMLFKLLDEKAWLVILFFFFPLPLSFPSYNIFLYFLFVVLLLFERDKKNDYLVGIILGLLILTKQSVGCCLLLPNLYYIKDLKKIFKRIIGILIPILIFFIYILINGCLYEFLNLCLFGLFDFASGNGSKFNLYFILFILMVGVTGYFIYKDRKCIYNYYAIMFYSVMIPLLDTYHFQVAFLAFLVVFLSRVKKVIVKPRLLSLGIIFGLFCFMFYKVVDDGIIYPNDIKHFEYRFLDTDSIKFTREVNQFIKDNQNKEIVFLSSNGYYFRLVNDMEISYIDLINKGNWGYDGSDMLLNEIRKKKDAIFLLDKSELSPIKQTDKKTLNYVIENGKKIGSIRIYDIYEFDLKNSEI